MTRRILIPLALSPDGVPRHAAGASVHTWHGLTMGTRWCVSLVACDPVDPSVQPQIQETLDQVVAQMSNWESCSDLSRFNRAPPGSWHDLPLEFFTVLEHALHVAQATGGAYDPTVGRLVDLWGFGPSGNPRQAPLPEALAQARLGCGWQQLSVDRPRRRVRQPGGVHVDLSGIAKGYGVDQVARLLTRLGFVSHLVEVGGELRGQGVKPDGQPWWVELERPPATRAGTVLDTRSLVALHGLAIATSGDYRRYFSAGGVRYSHTLDPRTGYPIPDSLASVTVLHPECMVADAMATALTVMGVRQGLDWAGRHGLAALFIERVGDEWAETLTPALAAMTE